jgi:hypothetical protein
MATYTPKRLANTAALTLSAATKYTAPSGGAVVKQIIFTNISTSTVTVRVHLITTGGSLAAGNAIIYDLSISGLSQIIWSADLPMDNGDFIQALAGTASAINMTISGIEIS